jgi:protein tyrosine/serine phosphatase
MHAWHIEREDVVGALRTLRSETRTGPTLLHCTLGADRTGLVAALYRMIYQGWSKEDALEEMEHGGFGFHDIWINIPRFIHELDMGELKRDVALP